MLRKISIRGGSSTKHYQKALSYWQQGEYQKALQELPKVRRGVEQKELLRAYIYRDMGRFVSEVEVLEKFIPTATVPALLSDAYSLLGQAYNILARSDEAVAAFLQSSRIESEAANYQQALVEASNAIFASVSSDCPDTPALFAEYQALLTKCVAPYPKAVFQHEKIRLAYLSSDFKEHPVGYLLFSLIYAHDRSKFELILYSNTKEPDKITELFAKTADRFIDITTLTDEAAAALIRSDEVDILIETNGHTKDNRLPILAYRPATLEGSMLGWVGSTGIPAVDFLIADRYTYTADPNYTEQIQILPHSHFVLSPLKKYPPLVADSGKNTGQEKEASGDSKAAKEQQIETLNSVGTSGKNNSQEIIASENSQTANGKQVIVTASNVAASGKNTGQEIATSESSQQNGLTSEPAKFNNAKKVNQLSVNKKNSQKIGGVNCAGQVRTHKPTSDKQPAPFTFGSMNNCSKITDSVILVWARILAQVPESRLFLKHKLYGTAEGRRYTQGRLADLGISKERVILEGFSTDYLSRYGSIDLALDSFPYVGGMTTLDALMMSVPVVTLAGTTIGSRFGASLLANLNLGELIAHSEAEYIEKAVLLAQNPEILAALRVNLRQMVLASPLVDCKAYTRDLEEILIRLYKGRQG